MAGGWGADYDDDGYQKRLEKYYRSFLNLTGFWPKVVPLFVRWMGKQFSTEGAYWNGAPWVPLSPRYAAWKALHYPGKGILVAEGDLLRGATTPKRRVTPQTLTLIIEWPKRPNRYTTRFDPDWHHSGTGRNPARPLLMEEWLNPEQRRELDDAADEYADEQARLFGL